MRAGTDVLDLSEIQLQKENAEYGVNIPIPCHDQVYLFCKRGFDIFAAVIAGAVMLIPMIFIAVLIRLESPGPAIFRQIRMGKDGKPFVMYKFRSMRMDAPREVATRELVDVDRYVTRVGAVLRRTSLDELPQLINVFVGNMSLVGYRPVCLTETRLNELRMQLGVFTMKPGITGLAQVCGRENISYEKKAWLDARYVRERSIKLDLWCLLKTVSVVISGEGVL